MFPESTDLYDTEIPLDIITDDSGQVIGEVYFILPDPPRRRHSKCHTNSILLQKSTPRRRATE